MSNYKKILIIVLFLVLYLILPKPTYMCMDGCYFGFLPPTGQLSTILLLQSQGVESFLFVFLAPFISIPFLLLGFLQGELPSGPNDFSISLWFLALILHIILIFLYYKFARSIIVFFEKKKKKEIISSKLYTILIVGTVIIGYFLVLETLSAVHAYKEIMIHREVTSQELNNVDAIKKAAEKCKSLEYKESACFNDIAGRINDIELCKDIFPTYFDYLEFRCIYRIVVERGDPTLCDKYVSFSEHMYQYPDCITDIAEKNKNPEICKLHNESKYRGYLNYEYIMQRCIEKASAQ